MTDWPLLARFGVLVGAFLLMAAGSAVVAVVALSTANTPTWLRGLLMAAGAAITLAGLALVCGPGPALR